METLLKTIMSYYEFGKESSEFEVNQFPSGKGNQEHYCEYLGGGDIFVTKKKESSTLSIVNLSLEGLEMSPTNSAECIPLIVIEGKKIDEDKEKLTKQLICNTILCCVTGNAKKT